MSQPRLLLIEDEARIRENIAALLTHSGYSVTTAQAGHAGLALARDEPFDLVVTDLVMEGFEGFELLEGIRARAPQTPIIVITGNTSTLRAEQAAAKGADAYLAKPFAIGDLRSAIEHLLGGASAS